MTNLHNISRTSSVVLAVALGACSPENAVITESASDSDTDTDTETTGDNPTTPTTVPTTMTNPTDAPTEPTTATETATETVTETATDSTATETATETATDSTDTGPDTETGDTDTTGDPVAELTAVWSTANPAGLGADLLVGLTPALDATTATQTVLGDIVSVQSLAYLNNDVIMTYDAPGGVGGVLIIDNLPNIMAAPIGLGTRRIAGDATGLIAPKGVEASGPGGLILVADTGAAGIHAFASDATGDVAPTFTITDIGMAEGVWDVHYVSADDTLYAAGTNGEVLVYSDFTMMQGQAGPDRTIVPSEAGEKISVNLHGITLDANTLYLTDVGDAMVADDGQIFVIEDADMAEGNVDVTQRIQGGDLGNPVDIEQRTVAVITTLYVAEKSNDKLLVYRRDLMNPEFALVNELEVVKPESVALRTGTTLLLSQNPAGIDGDGALLVNTPAVLAPTAGAVLSPLGSINSVQSVALTIDGLGYVGFDGPTASGGGGVFVVDALTGLSGEGQIDAIASRLWGPETGIVTPKGLALTAGGDRLFVADTAAANIKVFDTGNLGNVEPLFVFDDLGGGPVWDVAYDDASDRLYAAGVDGVVRVFDDALASMGNDAPARLITPTNGQDQISVNLHGIHFDAISKVLILSDVGDAMSPDDGQLFLIADADAADGQVEVLAAIGGDGTQLGNPVDIAFDGANLYVAEKSNSAVLRFDGILEFTGLDNNLPADASAEVANPESVQLFFSLP